MEWWQQQIDEHIAVRPLTVADATAVFALIDAERGDLREWLPWPDSIRSLGDEIDFLRLVESWHERGTAMICGIFIDGRYGGTIGFNAVDTITGHAEVGYWIARPWRGRGVMTRCCAALITWAFANLGLGVIILKAATGNTKSRHIAERLGFLQTSVIENGEQLADRTVDLALYVLTPEQWDANVL